MSGLIRRPAGLLIALLLAGLSVLHAFALPTEPDFEPHLSCKEDIDQLVEKTRELARRRSFDGLCATYVHWQLIASGIESSYHAGDARQEFAKYENKRVTDGGYLVEAIPASDCDLRGALEEIVSVSGMVRNVMVCFRTGTGSLARFGHVLMVRTIVNGVLYYTESSDWTVGKKKQKAGTMLTATVESFCKRYSGFRFAGIVHFYRAEEMPSSATAIAENGYTAADYLRTKRYVYDIRNPDGTDGLPVDSDGNGRITLADCTAIFASLAL
ncbi:MAG: hypothetical protein J5843_04440 [Clostridia bacterium]|nr:hypothetical protein [Clostridia bacterium]